MGDNNEVQACLCIFTNEAEKTIKLIQELMTRAHDLVQKVNKILDIAVKQTNKKKVISELQILTEKLLSINADLKLDYVDGPIFSIPYFTPGDDTAHRLIFLSGDNPWNFWLIDKNVDTKGVNKDLMKKFQSGLLDPVNNPQESQSVCFIDRNKAIRGIILQIKNENRIKIVDCDSNVTKVVTNDKLYKVDEEACRIHASALRCTITEDPDEIELWRNPDLRDLFCNTLREATLEVKIVKRVPGSFPTFVVDIELKNEEEDTANLKEWILNKLLPELKKIDNSDNEAICDFLSEESLSPFCKRLNEEVLLPVNQTNSPSKKESEELNNLNISTEKFSEKTVKDQNYLKKENHKIAENTNTLEKIRSKNTEDWVFSSNKSSKESLLNDCSQKAESVPDTRLNCNSEEFCPKQKKPDIPRFNKKYENKEDATELIKPVTSSNPISTCQEGLVPIQSQPIQPWSYTVMPPNLTCSQPPSPACSLTNVNVMAHKFVPRNNLTQPPKDASHVEFPEDQIILRKSATLIKENEIFKIFISHVESPSEFYVHFINNNNKHLDKLIEDMYSYYSTREKVDFISWQEAKSKMGKFCACKWPKDNQWYRVEVLEWCNEANLVKVWFVDHGNTDCVPLNCLQPLIRTFSNLLISCQACHLAKVHPIIKGQKWSKEAIEFFKSNVDVSNSILYSIEVVRSHENSIKNKSSLSVILFDDSSRSINDMLVDQGFAWSRKLLAESVSLASSETYHSVDNDRDSESDKLSSKAFDLVTSASPLEPNLLLQNFQDFDNFDPMKDDFESVRNNPALNTDDACVAVSGYSARDESRICQFYARSKFCYKAVCTKEHSMPNPDGVTTDKEEIYTQAFSQINLPEAGEVVKLKVTYVFDINIFYAQIEERSGIALDDEFGETLTSLVKLINSPGTTRQMKRLIIPPGVGELVLAKETDTDLWHRARVISYDDTDLYYEVMFVDYGSTSMVAEQDLRKIECRFLHLPFQAIECSLANIIPLKNETLLTQNGTELLQELLLGQVLTAKIYQSYGDFGLSHMEVVVDSKEWGDIGTLLVENGCADKMDLDWSMANVNCTGYIFPG